MIGGHFRDLMGLHETREACSLGACDRLQLGAQATFRSEVTGRRLPRIGRRSGSFLRGSLSLQNVGFGRDRGEACLPEAYAARCQIPLGFCQRVLAGRDRFFRRRAGKSLPGIDVL